tara:strand:+ start:2394 stop:3176 length:783 start_codon:yes stop_codon:yes gene_type:complete
MKIIQFIYIFALYILCIPGLFVKSKNNLSNYLLHALLFAILFFFTIYIVGQTKENYEQQASLSMNGINNLVNLIDTYKRENQVNIEIENEIKGSENAGAQCWNALGKTQKDIDTLRLQLDSYNGTQESLDKLNVSVIEYKDKILTLERELQAYRGETNSLENLRLQLNQYKDQLEALQKEILAFDGTDDSLEQLNLQLPKIKAKQDELTITLGKCNTATPGLISSETDLQSKYDANESEISLLKNEKGRLTSEITSRSNC